MSDTSLVIGRWQPFHKGHRELINTLLEEEKNVIVAIRDTKISDKNPWTYRQRQKRIKKEFGDRVRIIKIPDIDEFVYGRTPGYRVRQVLHRFCNISGTEIRRRLQKRK